MKKILTLSLLAIVAAGLLTWTYFLRHGGEPSIGNDESQLLPTLAERINTAAALTIVHQDDTVTLRRVGQSWQVVERDGYPADVDRLREWLIGLAHLEKIEPKTRKPEYYANLGLLDPAAAGANSTGVIIRDDQGEALAEVILGERQMVTGQPGVTQLYARVGDDPQTWLVQGRLPYPGPVNGWLVKDLLTLDRDAISEIRITQVDGQTVRIARQGDSSMAMSDPRHDAAPLVFADLPADAKLKAQPTPERIAGRLTQLRLDDVAASTADQGQPNVTVTVQRRDGLVVTIQAVRLEDGDEDWLKLAAVFDATLREAPAAGPADPEVDEEDSNDGQQAGKASANLAPPEVVEQEVADLNARWSGWRYRVPAYVLTDLDLTLVDLIETAATAEEEPQGIGEPSPDMAIEGLD